MGFEHAFRLADPEILDINYYRLGIHDEIIKIMIKLDSEDQLLILLGKHLRELIDNVLIDASDMDKSIIYDIIYHKVHGYLIEYLSKWRGSKYYTKKDKN